MRFAASEIDGCKLVELQRNEDSRGFFARTWCSEEFGNAGLPGTIVQASISYNRRVGTLRGMHYQSPPSREGKLVRCVRGAIFDVVIDIRGNSGSFLHVVTATLNEDNRDALYIPPGCAHGFQTLTDDTEVLYLMTDTYRPDLSGGFRWNDPQFNVRWPVENPIVNDRDASYDDFDVANARRMHW